MIGLSALAFSFASAASALQAVIPASSYMIAAVATPATASVKTATAEITSVRRWRLRNWVAVVLAPAARPDSIVAAEIRAELARQRISHSALAEKLGVSRAYLSRRLSGDTPLSVPDLAAIAAILGVPISKLTEPADQDTSP
ncbi:MAG: helix-turn-helix domain-containing protein [Streptosporangiales bacterium]|nr:helix-turn-helix domain-containing protein [Streptosporangiales bacterium]